MEMEIGFIEGVRFITSPRQPYQLHLKHPKKMRAGVDLDSHWRPLFKEVRAHQPRITAQRSASSRKRKALWHAVSRRVPNGYIAFL